MKSGNDASLNTPMKKLKYVTSLCIKWCCLC